MLVPNLGIKRLEILKEILTKARRFGALNDCSSRSPAKLQAMEEGTWALGQGGGHADEAID